MPKRLTKKEQGFCYHFYKLQNAKEAAIHCGVPPRKAEEFGNCLLLRKDILEEIRILEEQYADRQLLQKAKQGLLRIAFCSPSDSLSLLFGDPPFSQERLASLDLFCISEIKVPRGGGLEIKLFDRIKALDLLSKLLFRSDSPDAISSGSLVAAIEQSAKALGKSASFDGEFHEEDI